MYQDGKSQNIRDIVILLAVMLSLARPGSGQQAKPASEGGPRATAGGLIYLGTIDKKLLVIDEAEEKVIDEIALEGVPRTTALSADKKKLYLINTRMGIEIVDLAARKVVSSFKLADDEHSPRVGGIAPERLDPGHFGRFSGLAVDPLGRYLYATMRTAVKGKDRYTIEPAKFAVIDLEEKKFAKTFEFPKEFDQGFGFRATYKVSPDGKLLYVFQDDILIFDLSTFKQVDKIELAQPPYPGASPYRLTAGDDPNDEPGMITSVFTAVDPVVKKGILGLARLNLATRTVDFKPIGPSLPMIGFQLAPDRKRGYSVMFNGVGGNRRTEWWVWDLATQKVIKKEEFPSRPTFRFAVGSSGKKLYFYGAGSTIEVFDAETLQSRKLIYLNRDSTTNLISLPGQTAVE
jgi:DNA-binding beta-propeller fold protein YncE